MLLLNIILADANDTVNRVELLRAIRFVDVSFPLHPRLRQYFFKNLACRKKLYIETYHRIESCEGAPTTMSSNTILQWPVKYRSLTIIILLSQSVSLAAQRVHRQFRFEYTGRSGDLGSTRTARAAYCGHRCRGQAINRYLREFRFALSRRRP